MTTTAVEDARRALQLASEAWATRDVPAIVAHLSAAVRGFTEALRIELDVERCGVSATAVHPGGIKTAIARRARIDPELADEAGGADRARAGFEKLFITSAEEAARQIVVAVQKDKRRAMIGPDASRSP